MLDIRAVSPTTQSHFWNFISQNFVNNFTPRAQQVLALARQEARRLHHNSVDTEHLLSGLMTLGQGVAVTVLQKMGLDLDVIQREVENGVGRSPEIKPVDYPPYTLGVKKVLALAGREAKSFHHNYVGTEHILLGLLRDESGVAARVLTSFGADLPKARMAILQELNPHLTPDSEEMRTLLNPPPSTPWWERLLKKLSRRNKR